MDLVTIRFFVQASPEARQKALRRMLTQNPKVKVHLTEGQKRALALRDVTRGSNGSCCPLPSVLVRDEDVVTVEEIDELRARIARLERRDESCGAPE